MRFENNMTFMTPAEADYVETICMYREHDSAATALKWRMRSVELNWALEVLPSEEVHQGHELGYAFTKGTAMLKYGDLQQEVINIQLSSKELKLVTRLAIEKTAAILERAGKFERQIELYDDVEQQPGEIILSEDEDEMIKAGLFEQDLKYLALGYSVLSVLLNRDKT